jgi:aryl-alcohol dehydrogenase-like predicted oxidoreductase
MLRGKLPPRPLSGRINPNRPVVQLCYDPGGDFAMSKHPITRRQFIKDAASSAGAAVVSPCWAGIPDATAPKTAADQVSLGSTGIRLSRLGIGTGTGSGSVQRGLGHDRFNDLIRYAYDRGITYFDMADAYGTHSWVREAVRGLPREKLYIQTKIAMGFRGNPEPPVETIDRFRRELNMDYLDSVLIHCQIDPRWDEQSKGLRDGLAQAKEKKTIRAHGVSCHSLPATKKAAVLDWVNVNLVRINPQGVNIDTPELAVFANSNESHVPAVVEQLKLMRKNGHGIIGMKLIGEGRFTNIEDRRKSLTWVMQSGIVDAVVIGFKSRDEIDEAIRHINNAFAG